MLLCTASLFTVLSPIDGGALPKETPKIAGDHASLCFSLCRGCPTRLLRGYPETTLGLIVYLLDS
jgi:hypothetical protein